MFRTFTLGVLMAGTIITAMAQTDSAAPSEESFRKHLRAAREARESGDLDEEITALRTAYITAVQLQLPEGIFQSTQALDQAFKESDKPMERVGALRSGSTELKKLGTDKSLWAAQIDVALAIALEDQSKRGEAATTAKKAVGVLESALGLRSREYRETLRMLSTMFEEDGNASIAGELGAKYNAIEQAREAEPLFGYQADPKIRTLLQRLRAAVARPQNIVEVQWSLGQIASGAEKIDAKSPYRARAFSEAAAICLNPKKKLDSKIGLIAEGYLRKAIDLHERALENRIAETSETSLEVVHFRDLQSDILLLGDYYAKNKETSKQEELLKRGLAVAERVLGENHPALAGPLRQLANYYYGVNNKDQIKRLAEGAAKDDSRLDAAIALGERELSIYGKAFGANDPILLNTVQHLAQLHWVKGSSARAKEFDTRINELKEQLYAFKAPEKTLQDEVRQLKAFLRFEDAAEQVETFKKLYPDKTAPVAQGGAGEPK